MTNVDFEIEDPVRKWKREADERQAEIDAERENEQRERERARCRAQREANGDWDRYFHGLLEIEREFLYDVVGSAMGEMIADLRRELEKKMQVSLRIALLEQGGLVPRVRGTWQATEAYSALDICIHDGAAWIAKHSNPGTLPGEGWQLIACRGLRGLTGERGPRGETGPAGPRGELGPTITGWKVDAKRFQVLPILDGGRGGFGPPLDLRELFLEFQKQTEVEPVPAGKSAASKRPPGHAAPLVRLINGGREPEPQPLSDEPVPAT